MIKKTIQRNHVFAIYTLLLKNAILVNDPFRVDLKDAYSNCMVSNVCNIVFFFAT